MKRELFLLSFLFLTFSLFPNESFKREELWNPSSFDPLTFIFYTDENREEELIFQMKLMNYASFYWEGQHLTQSCENNTLSVTYSTLREESEAKRSFLSTLQYVGLDVTVRAIVAYAKKFDFSQEEFRNLTQRIVGNFCSPNLSVISLKELRKNLLSKFVDEKFSFALPQFKDNPLFNPLLAAFDEDKEGLEREFSLTVSLFRSFCSFGGDPDSPGLLLALASNPMVASFVVRMLSGYKIVWDPHKSFISVPDRKTAKILCRDALCRRVDEEKFLTYFPKALGSRGLESDLKGLYCKYYFSPDKKLRKAEPSLKKWLLAQSKADEVLVISQWLSLLTRTPDFVTRIVDREKILETFRWRFNEEWDRWAKKALRERGRYLFYEEELLLEQRKFQRPPILLSKPHFEISFDLNAGELDRTFWHQGKLHLSATFFVREALLSSMQQELARYASPRYQKKLEEQKRIYQSYFVKDLEVVQKKFLTPLWQESLAPPITKELFDQLSYYGEQLRFSRTGTRLIPVNLHFYYGLYALKRLAQRQQ